MAQDALSSTIQVTHIQGNTYQINYHYAYHMRNGPAAPTAWLNFQANACNSGGSKQLPLRLTTGPTGIHCHTNKVDSILTSWYQDTLTLPASCPEWRFSVGAQNSASQNLLPSQPLYTETIIYNSNTSNNSTPFFQRGEVAHIEATVNVTYSLQAIDIESDSLVYSFVTPLAASNTAASYAPGFSLQQPFPSVSNIFISPVSGMISPYPSAAGIGKNYVVQVKIDEYRNVGGNILKLSTTFKSIIIHIVPPLPPPQILNLKVYNQNKVDITSSFQGPNDIYTCESNKFYFKLENSDTTQAAKLIPNLSPTHPIFKLQYIGSRNDSAVLNILPDSSYYKYIGKRLYLNLEIEDGSCPIPGKRVYTMALRINKRNQVQIQADTTTLQPGQSKQLLGVNLRPDTLQNGQQVQFRYQWVPSTGLSNDTILNPVASPAQTTRYTLFIHNTAGAGCADSASVLVRVAGSVSSVKDQLQHTTAALTTVLSKSNGSSFEVPKQWQGSKLIIYNTSGQVVQQYQQYENQWRGLQQPEGLYIYQLLHPEKGILNGKVLLVR
ncbi:MAG: hypothetical protein LPJ89_03780 [Hymenobacteraceae bacterium]|nr:hypothetical protein [Hymenobacteraceae bacterium]MDX5442884.1 hypothetical protein [Hymenobacteraceae bacterium]MDX5513131.1 hypothetical protein [Hymenobacteraceae bacterium]